MAVTGFVVHGINSVNTTTLERRFDLPSRQVAWITSAFGLVSGALAIVIGYAAMSLHKPRLMSWMALITALGSFTMCLPHLIVGPYHLGKRLMDVCTTKGKWSKRRAIKPPGNEMGAVLYDAIQA